MSTQDDDNLELNDDGNGVPALRARVKQLEKENKELKAFETENKTLKQKDSLREAGLDLSGAKLTALIAAHGEGEQTPEAFRKTAEDLGFAEPIPENDPADVNAHRQIADTTTGAHKQGQQQSYEDEVATARNPEELAAIAQKHGRPFVG